MASESHANGAKTETWTMTVQPQVINVDTNTDQNAADRKIADLRKEVDELKDALLQQMFGSNRRSRGECSWSWHINNADIKIPSFKNENLDDPIEFLSDLERYFAIKNTPEEVKLVLVETALQDRAKLWYGANKISFFNYLQFRKAFYNEFFCIETRVKTRNRWATSKYDGSGESLVSYFYKKTRESNNFEPPLDQYEINYTIVKQYPTNIQVSLAGVDYNDTKKIVQVLSFLDTVEEDKKKNQPTVQFTLDKEVSSINKSQKNGNKYKSNVGYSNHKHNNSQGFNHTDQNNRGTTNFSNIQHLDFSIPPPNYSLNSNLN